MQISVSPTLTVYHDGQFWVGLAERVEDGRYGVARIVFGAEPSNEEILQFVTSKWAKLAFFGDKVTETSKPAKSPKRRAHEAAKALKRPAVSTKAQQTLAAQRETMKWESARARSQRRADEAELRFEQRENSWRIPNTSRSFLVWLRGGFDACDITLDVRRFDVTEACRVIQAKRRVFTLTSRLLMARAYVRTVESGKSSGAYRTLSGRRFPYAFRLYNQSDITYMGRFHIKDFLWLSGQQLE